MSKRRSIFEDFPLLSQKSANLERSTPLFFDPYGFGPYKAQKIRWTYHRNCIFWFSSFKKKFADFKLENIAFLEVVTAISFFVLFREGAHVGKPLKKEMTDQQE